MRMAAAISHYTIGRILMEDVQSASSTIEKAHQQMQKLPWLPAPILAELDRTKSQVAALHREVHCYQKKFDTRSWRLTEGSPCSSLLPTQRQHLTRREDWASVQPQYGMVGLCVIVSVTCWCRPNYMAGRVFCLLVMWFVSQGPPLDQIDIRVKWSYLACFWKYGLGKGLVRVSTG